MRHDTWMTIVSRTQRCAILSFAALEPRVLLMLSNSAHAVVVGLVFTPSSSRSVLVRMRFRKCSSCASPHQFQQSPSSKLPGPPNSFTAERSPPASTTQQRIEQRSSKLCTPRAQTITTSVNQRYATMMK